MLSSREFRAFSQKHVMFLNIMTRIDGYPQEDMLGKVGGRGFPTFRILDKNGKVIGSPAGRSMAAFAGAMAAVPAPAAVKARPVDRVALAMELLRQVKLGKLTSSPADRAAFTACRSALKPEQIALVEHFLAQRALQEARATLAKIKADKGEFKPTVAARLAAVAAQIKLGKPVPKELFEGVSLGEAKEELGIAAILFSTTTEGTPAYDTAILRALRARELLGKAWLREPTAAIVLPALCNHAEAKRDAHLFRVWMNEARGLRGATRATALYNQDRLRRLEQDISSLRRYLR